MDDITLVIVDNGDIEPEAWAFADPQDANTFAELRGGAMLMELPILDNVSAQMVIENERRQA